jgi:hypothetical protein
MKYVNQMFITGLSSEGKPTNENKFCEFYETDNDISYIYNGATWILKENFFDSYVSSANSITTVTPGVYQQITWGGGTSSGSNWTLTASKAVYSGLKAPHIIVVSLGVSAALAGSVVVRLVHNTTPIKTVTLPLGVGATEIRTIVLAAAITVEDTDNIWVELTSSPTGDAVTPSNVSFAIKK